MEEKKFKDMLLLGHDVIEEAGRADDDKALPQISPQHEDFYSELINALINLRFPEENAREHWKEIVKHKWFMSEQLRRNVGIRVAALDYFQNIKGLVKRPTIVEVTEFADITWKAMTDSLTGLYNHRHFQNSVNAQIKALSSGDKPFSVVMLDLDFFKIYNDSNGHVAGDVVLVEVAGIIRSRIRPEDVPSRYGGEEFGIVLPGADAERAFETAESIRTAVTETGFANEEVMPFKRITLSGGTATAPEDGDNRKDVISAADARLYKAKRSGRNQVCRQ